jgi:hypothetical protein
MVFTVVEEAKPKVPHDDGLTCIHCGANEASQWRGPHKRYCSKAQCKKAATAARKSATSSSWEEKLKAVEDDVEAHDGRMEKLEDTLAKRCEGYEKRLAAQADWLEKQDATIARLEALVMRMQKQLPAGAGSKRAALGALPAQPTPR